MNEKCYCLFRMWAVSHHFHNHVCSMHSKLFITHTVSCVCKCMLCRWDHDLIGGPLNYQLCSLKLLMKIENHVRIFFIGKVSLDVETTKEKTSSSKFNKAAEFGLVWFIVLPMWSINPESGGAISSLMYYSGSKLR